jgi:hypothetical protein
VRVPTLSLRHRAFPRSDGPSVSKQCKISMLCSTEENSLNPCYEIIKMRKPDQFKPQLTYSQKAKAGAARSARHHCAYEGRQPKCRSMGPEFSCKGCMPVPPSAPKRHWEPPDYPERGASCPPVVLAAARFTAGVHAALPAHAIKQNLNNGNLSTQ